MPIAAIFSDLHFEFHADWGRSYIESMDPTDVDVLILAGDICYARNLGDTLKRFRDRYPSVVACLGNHEFYKDEVQNVLETVAKIDIPGVHILQQQVVEVAGLKIAGSTLWFKEPKDYDTIRAKQNMSDFHVIKNFEPFVYEENARAVRFLDGLKPGDAHIVVTHHLPHPRSVSQQYQGDPLNPFFLCDVARVMDQAKPMLWVHGHTHDTIDFKHGETRVMANPLGYPHGGNPRHRDNLKMMVVPEARLLDFYP